MENNSAPPRGSVNILVVGLVTALLVVLAMPMVSKILTTQPAPMTSETAVK